MNHELAKCRAHYQTLPPHVKDRATAKHLLAAIQIAEKAQQDNERLVEALRKASPNLPPHFGDDTKSAWAVDEALARVSEPEDK